MLPVIFLMGPTASGKTALAIEAYKHLPVDLISVDSAMIYRGMDIGTGKPSPEELTAAPHALIDICAPDAAYSAQEFCEDACKLIRQSHTNGRIPLLVGGTMLYFNALLNGLAPLPSADKTVREKLNAKAQAKGWDALHQELLEIDPVAGNRIHPNDPQRIQRALEVYLLTGKTLTEHFEEKQSFIAPESVLQIALHPQDKSWLHQRIETRFLQMLEMGFIAEVEGILSNYNLTESSPALRCVGYRQVWEFLQGQTTESQMIEKAITATRQLAKRQMTWLRSWPTHQEVPAEKTHANQFVSLVSNWLKERETVAS